MSAPLVSFIIPVLNQKQELQLTLESILQQNFLDYEIIVIDGKSSDGTVEVIKSQEKHLSYWESSEDKNVYEAMNKGIQNTKGKWLYFLGAGDCINPNILQYIFSHNTDSFLILYGNVLYDNNTLFYGSFSRELFLRNSIHHQGALYHKNCFCKNTFNTKWKILADYAINLSLFLADKPALYLNECFANCKWDGISKQKGFALYQEEFQIKKEMLNAVQLVVYGGFTWIKFLLQKINLL